MADNASLIAKAQAVVDAITFDEHGALVGGQWQGGGGGILSRDTLKLVDGLRRELSTWPDQPAQK